LQLQGFQPGEEARGWRAKGDVGAKSNGDGTLVRAVARKEPTRELRNEQEEPAIEARTRVGQVLQQAREDFGLDLRSVAESLRIRYPYLSAIEESRYQDLPGPTYALGFVRTYAEFLGLDSGDVVRQFKKEFDGHEQPADLNFPAPVQEGRVPRGAVVMIALLVAAFAYGGWYYLSSHEIDLAEVVEPVPEHLRALVIGSEAPAELTEEPATSAEMAAAEPKPEPASPPPMQAELESGETGGQALGETEQSAEAVAPGEAIVSEEKVAAEMASEFSDPPGSESDASTTPFETGAAAATPEGDNHTGAELPASASLDEEPAAGPMSEQTLPDMTQAAVSEGEAPDASGAPAEAIPEAPSAEQVVALGSSDVGGVFGNEGETRIVLKAKLDSWVQVRDAEDNLLLTRVLRPGDSYRVPNQEGLTLLTGNAGGLAVLVDGQEAPALGPIGAVRRNVALDPERLMAGEARAR
jgi:cytoskeleton protein RodZ